MRNYIYIITLSTLYILFVVLGYYLCGNWYITSYVTTMVLVTTSNELARAMAYN
jgi:uncharacterized membrane protein